MTNFRLNVNGAEFSVTTNETTPVLSVLRDNLHLMGAKPGCGEGQCGACTVLVDGNAIHSCITPISDVAARSVVTIEGLGRGAQLHPVQQAFLDHSAFQCGYCTPGMIMACVALLKKNPHPTVQDIRRELNGNLCRCGTYARIIKAVQQAAESAQDG
ncbi:MAG TPA: (2Fe-2S)-binding protein [Bryobacteraceae bacterium]|jgi:aerobic-type carbon monoxide dehydrogenase small subunit (CoxS/CutS family)|nr:(2Fe-2S)-binding protein [Bryobacteraceae bacterium]